MSASECIVCSEKIKTNAKKCIHCKSWQYNWLNYLEFLAKNIALITLILSGAFWIWSNLSIPRDDVNLIRLWPYGPVVVHNSGNRNVLLVDYFVYLADRKNWKGFNPAITELMEPGDTVTKYVGTTLEENKKLIWLSKGEIDEDEWSSIINKAIEDDLCYPIVFFYQKDPYFLNIEALSTQGIWQLPANGYIQYFSYAEGKMIRKSIAVTATIARLNIEECASS